MGKRGSVQIAGERGATMVEYAIILALIALVLFAVVASLGLGTADAFGKVEDALPDALDGSDPWQPDDEQDCGPDGVARRVGWDHSNNDKACKE